MMQQSYWRLVDVAQATVKQVKEILARFHTEKTRAIQRSCQRLTTFLPRVEQVIEQTIRRVFAPDDRPFAHPHYWAALTH